MPDFQKWFSDKGDQTLRLTYPLSKDSVVLDVGGYEGKWAAQIYERYGCNIHIFEPVPKFANNIKQRFSGNTKICVHDFGMSNVTDEQEFHIMDDASSIYVNSGVSCKAKMYSAVEIFNKLFSNVQIDLIKINIEGCEYNLLDHMLDNKLVKKLNNIQVQFHEGLVTNSETRMMNIQKRLSETHSLTWQYVFVWENWQIKV